MLFRDERGLKAISHSDISIDNRSIEIAAGAPVSCGWGNRRIFLVCSSYCVCHDDGSESVNRKSRFYLAINKVV